MAYTGKLLWLGGKPSIHRKDNLIEWLSQYPDDTWFELTVNPIGNINNSDQSKLYHKWCDIIAEEFGWDSGNAMHTYFKEQYNNKQSTKSFDTKDWSTYMNKILAFAGEHNITLPIGNSNDEITPPPSKTKKDSSD